MRNVTKSSINLICFPFAGGTNTAFQ